MVYEISYFDISDVQHHISSDGMEQLKWSACDWFCYFEAFPVPLELYI